MCEYEFDPITGCHLVKNGVLRDGYAITRSGKLCHRLVWELAIGPIPKKLQLDHLCRRRNCIRLEHLDLVTNRENTRRVFARYRRTISICPAGHDLDDGNVIETPEGGRVCRICSL